MLMLKGFRKRNLKSQFSKPASESEKQLRQQILRGKKKMSKNDKLLEKEDHIYVPGEI